jgi:HNH endonuclease
MPEHDSTIEYRDIEGYPGFKAGSDGTIWTCRPTQSMAANFTVPHWRMPPHYLASTKKRFDYLCVSTTGCNPKGKEFVHTLVAIAFHGVREKGKQVCHNNGNHRDNRAENLRWGTHTENARDKYEHRTMPIGAKNHNSLLTDEIVVEARRLKLAGLTYRQIGTRLGFTREAIRGAVSGRNWLHVTEIPPVKGFKLTKVIYEECIIARDNGEQFKTIATRYGVLPSTVSRWVSGKTKYAQ